MRFFPATITKIYDVLSRHANARTQICWPSLATIGKESGVTGRSTIIKGIRTLEQYRLIGVARSPHKANRYLMCDCRVWLPVDQSNQMTTHDDTGRSDSKTAIVKPEDRSGHLVSTPTQKSESEKEIKEKENSFERKTGPESILEHLDSGMKSLVLNDFEIEKTIKALEDLETEGIDLSRLSVSRLCFHLAKRDIRPKKRRSWINYDDVKRI